MESTPDLRISRNLGGERSYVGHSESEEWVDIQGGGSQLPREFVVGFWPRDGVDEPAIEVHFAVIDGVPQCRGVIASSMKGGRELRRSDLRAIALEDILENASYQLRRVTDSDVVQRPLVEDWRADTRSAVRESRRAGKRTMTDAMLKRVAEVYTANPGAPTVAVADEFDVADRTARLYVKSARDAGLLPPAARGGGRADG